MQWHDQQPIYQQLKQKIMSAIMTGTFKEGEAISSIRQVAEQYQINHLTVAKAYQILVDDGILEKRRGLGMFVTPNAQQRLIKNEQHLFLTQEWPQILQRIKELGLSIKELPNE